MSMNTVPERLAALRAAMKANGVDVYLIPVGDPHSSEYLPDHYTSLTYFSGFHGENSNFVVTMTESAVWADGRYFVQAEKEIAGTEIQLMRMGEPGVPTAEEYCGKVLPEGGTLDIGARLLPADDDGTTWYELSVADSGTGIADDIMPHIFEPFFTTHRQAGRAAGLGLSVATGLAHGRGGQITAANRPEGGALFRLLLPLPVSESRSEGNE